MTVAYRRAELADRAFICDGFVTSYRLARAAGLISMEHWRDIMWAEFEYLLDRPTVTTIVAYDPKERDKRVDLTGFIAADVTEGTPLVIYVYVKGPYRKWGYARGLFAALDIDPRRRFAYACATPVVAELRDAGKIPRAYFDPISARFPDKNGPKEKHDHRSHRAAAATEVVVEERRARPRGG